MPYAIFAYSLFPLPEIENVPVPHIVKETLQIWYLINRVDTSFPFPFPFPAPAPAPAPALALARAHVSASAPDIALSPVAVPASAPASAPTSACAPTPEILLLIVDTRPLLEGSVHSLRLRLAHLYQNNWTATYPCLPACNLVLKLWAHSNFAQYSPQELPTRLVPPVFFFSTQTIVKPPY